MPVGEWDQRQLCPDGTCIGVIGPEGTCKVCGRAAPNWGDERNRGLLAPDEDAEEEDLASNDEYGDDDEDGDDYDDEDGDDDDGEDDDGDDDPDDDGDGAIRAAAVSEPAAADAAPRADWTERALCPDGACIGVIGADGRCKVCGRSASGAPAEPSPAAGAAAAELAAPPVSEASPAAETASPAEGTAAAAPVPASASATASPAAATSPDPAAGREACVVTGCGGYIGDAGRCMLCGRGAS